MCLRRRGRVGRLGGGLLHGRAQRLGQLIGADGVRVRVRRGRRGGDGWRDRRCGGRPHVLGRRLLRGDLLRCGDGGEGGQERSAETHAGAHREVEAHGAAVPRSRRRRRVPRSRCGCGSCLCSCRRRSGRGDRCQRQHGHFAREGARARRARGARRAGLGLALADVGFVVADDRGHVRRLALVLGVHLAHHLRSGSQARRQQVATHLLLGVLPVVHAGADETAKLL
jgi:hypothetical protein